MKSLDKKGLELAANTIVMLIVSIVIFGFAMSISYGVFCGAQEYSAEVDAQSQQQVKRLLSSGGKVQVADNTKKAQSRGSVLCGGQRTVGAEFTLGIRDQGNTEESMYTIEVEGANQYGADVQYFPGPGEQVPILRRQVYTTSILINLPLEPQETQVYTVRVYDASESLYGVQQLYITP